jgi:two-component system, cell cycle sensor histidine kinase and response regulator CckA
MHPDCTASRRTILIVEDTDIVRKYLCTVLRERGFEVLEARNGKEGLQVCEAFQVDLVCTDVIMPVMDGIEFYKELQKTAPHLKVFFTSGSSLPETFEKEIPADSFIEKTIDLSILLNKLETSLSMSK